METLAFLKVYIIGFNIFIMMKITYQLVDNELLCFYNSGVYIYIFISQILLEK